MSKPKKKTASRPWPELLFSGLALLLVALSLSTDPGADLKRHAQTLPREPIRGAPLSEAPRRTAPTDPAQQAAFAKDVGEGNAREGFLPVEFSLLAGFQAALGVPLPSAVAALDGQIVTITGYMVPVAFSDDKVSAFVLVRNQLLCCYGQEPRVNEWVFVECAPPVKPLMDEPVQVFGRLRVAPEGKDGELACLYRLQADVVEQMP